MKTQIVKKILSWISISLFIVSCQKNKSCSNCDSSNKLPVANAGYDITIVLPLDSILLDGSASKDPDGSIVSYQWSAISGPASFYIVSSQTISTVVKNLVQGTYRFELKVTDNSGSADRDTIMVIVNDAVVINYPPVANAGNDTTVRLPSGTVTLDGSRSYDPDNNISTYTWRAISGFPGYLISTPNAVQTEVTGLLQGYYLFELKVTDAGGLVSADTVGVSVIPDNVQEIILANQVLVNLCYQENLPGACVINGDSPSYGFNIKDTSNILPGLNTVFTGVWVRMDTSLVWVQVPRNCWQFPDPYPQTDFTYCYRSDGFSVWTWFMSLQNLGGRTVDLKLQY